MLLHSWGGGGSNERSFLSIWIYCDLMNCRNCDKRRAENFESSDDTWDLLGGQTHEQKKNKTNGNKDVISGDNGWREQKDNPQRNIGVTSAKNFVPQVRNRHQLVLVDSVYDVAAQEEVRLIKPLVIKLNQQPATIAYPFKYLFVSILITALGPEITEMLSGPETE